jgi:hypothetical protein
MPEVLNELIPLLTLGCPSCSTCTAIPRISPHRRIRLERKDMEGEKPTTQRNVQPRTTIAT